MPRLRRQVTIVNRLGLHARPASVLVKEASRFAAEIHLARDGYEVNGKSIMGVMMLAAEQGAVVEIIASGADAEEAVAALQALIDSGFGED
ncbi:MAG: HPr family phosphocarrier protein [Candidatus Eiseniibacteriota bacterium]|jgi:phosphocarrier protein